jgi:hypothetical protein
MPDTTNDTEVVDVGNNLFCGVICKDVPNGSFTYMYDYREDIPGKFKYESATQKLISFEHAPAPGIIMWHPSGLNYGDAAFSQAWFYHRYVQLTTTPAWPATGDQDYEIVSLPGDFLTRRRGVVL